MAGLDEVDIQPNLASNGKAVKGKGREYGAYGLPAEALDRLLGAIGNRCEHACSATKRKNVQRQQTLHRC